MRFLFVTGTPATVREGSGTWTGISTLAGALRGLGHAVELRAIRDGAGSYEERRDAFNASLRAPERGAWDVVVGFDMDGHGLAGRGGPPHVASIKGVIADEARFEEGETRRMMERQAALEAEHCRRADLVLTTSAYSAGRLRELYRLDRDPAIVPELIELDRWRERMRAAPARKRDGFTVLCVCKLYPRKRVDVLLRAAARLRGPVPGLRVRIVGDGPGEERLRALHRELALDGTVEWLGFVPPDALATEYRSCDVFCLPSVQEGFGIVFLEAMAAGVPIVAARAAAIPEVVTSGILAGPDDPGSLADALLCLAHDPALRDRLAAGGRDAVRAFDAPRVARRFLDAITAGQTSP